jgi:hypothetical protein
MPADRGKYIDVNIKLYIRGKLVKEDGKGLDATDHTAVTNNLLHSLFIQCTVSLNGISITQASKLCPYRSYLETILTYGTDAAYPHLTNAFWYPDDGNLLPCDSTAAADANTNKRFVARWNRIKQSKKFNFTAVCIATFATSRYIYFQVYSSKLNSRKRGNLSS